MRQLLESLTYGIYLARATTLPQAVLRLVVAAFGVAAALASAVWAPWGFTSALCIVAVIGAVASARWPGSGMPAATAVAILALWAPAGADAPWWQWLVTAMLLAGFHFSCALAAVAPTWAAAPAKVLGSWVASALKYLALALVATGFVILLALVLVPSLPGAVIWATLGAGALLAPAVGVRWWLSRG